MNRKLKWVLLAPLFLIGFLLFIALGGLIVQWLWNWLIPPIFNLPAVTFWQALGLLLLCRILFGGWGGRSSGMAGRRAGERARQRAKERMAERMATMTPEEQERFRQKMRGWCEVDAPPEPPADTQQV